MKLFCKTFGYLYIMMNHSSYWCTHKWPGIAELWKVKNLYVRSLSPYIYLSYCLDKIIKHVQLHCRFNLVNKSYVLDFYYFRKEILRGIKGWRFDKLSNIFFYHLWIIYIISKINYNFLKNIFKWKTTFNLNHSITFLRSLIAISFNLGYTKKKLIMNARARSCEVYIYF